MFNACKLCVYHHIFRAISELYVFEHFAERIAAGRPSKKLQGLFSRPMQRKWVETTASGQWRQYLTASLLLNVDAAGKTASLGLSPVSFAARCDADPNQITFAID